MLNGNSLSADDIKEVGLIKAEIIRRISVLQSNDRDLNVFQINGLTRFSSCILRKVMSEFREEGWSSVQFSDTDTIIFKK